MSDCEIPVCPLTKPHKTEVALCHYHLTMNALGISSNTCTLLAMEYTTPTKRIN